MKILIASIFSIITAVSGNAQQVQYVAFGAIGDPPLSPVLGAVPPPPAPLGAQNAVIDSKIKEMQRCYTSRQASVSEVAKEASKSNISHFDYGSELWHIQRKVVVRLIEARRAQIACVLSFDNFRSSYDGKMSNDDTRAMREASKFYHLDLNKNKEWIDDFVYQLIGIVPLKYNVASVPEW